MKYITITAREFDEALRKAKEEYGSDLRIHSRRDATTRGGFLWLKKKTHVELTCYIAEKKEDPHKIEEPAVEKKLVEPEVEPSNPLLEHAATLLLLNGFSSSFSDLVLDMVQESLASAPTSELSTEEFELLLIDTIVSLIRIDHQSLLKPPQIFVLLGPTGAGKTTTIAKIAALYGLQSDPEFYRNVKLVTIDSFRIGAFEQLSAFGESMGIVVEKVTDEQQLYQILEHASEDELILIDTIGRSPRDKELELKMKTLLAVAQQKECSCFIALSASMKEEDLQRVFNQYTSFKPKGIIMTKVDETKSIGNVLSLSYEKQMPLLFFTDGQRVPKDIHKASLSSLLGLLQGFTLDFEALWANQIGPVEP
ncbi:MAG: hypothetical protein ACOXZ4_04985 [Sphaerochaetaceae bacterium]